MGYTPALIVRDKIQHAFNFFGISYTVNGGCITTVPTEMQILREVARVLGSDTQVRLRTRLRISRSDNVASVDKRILYIDINGTDAVFDSFYTKQHYAKRYASG